MVPVGVLDRRALGALMYACNLPTTTCMAVHVSEDDGETHGLGLQWMASAFSHVPLHILKGRGGIARLVAEAVREEADAQTRDVTVVIGHMVLPHPWLRLLHNRTSDAIARALSGLPTVMSILVGVPVGKDETAGLDVLICRSIAPDMTAARRRTHSPY